MMVKLLKNNTKAIIDGYEGIMIKIQILCECKRSTTWLKLKPVNEISLEVTIEEGTGRNKGKLGALIAEGEEDGKFLNLI